MPTRETDVETPSFHETTSEDSGPGGTEKDETWTPDGIIQELGGCGRFQMALAITIQAMKIVVCWGMVGNAFFAYTPAWRCVDDTQAKNHTIKPGMTFTTQRYPAENVTSVVEYWEKKCENSYGGLCSNYEFESTPRTFVDHFGLVCDLTWVTATITSIQMGGMCLGSVVSGQLADTFGRKFPLYVAMALLGVFHLISYFSVSWVMLAVCRMFIGIGSAFFLTIYGIIQSEFALARWRSVMVSFPSWAIESALFALVAWLLQDWQYLTVIMIIMALVFFIVCWFVPESFRWFLANDRFDDLEKTLRKVAKVNGKQFPDFSRMRRMENAVKADESAKKYTIFVLFTKIRLLKLTIPLVIVWLTMGLVSYGINFGIQQLSGNIYLNIFLFSIASFPAKMASIYLQNRFGRKRASIFALGVCLLGGFAVGIVQYIDTPYRDDVTTYCALVANMAMDGTWGPVQTLTLEVYPTVVRNMGFGFVSVMARLGAVIGPQFVFLNNLVPGLLYFVVGLTCLLSILGLMTLPETMNASLVDKLVIDEHKTDAIETNAKV